MLHCNDVQPNLSAYLDRELPAWKMQLVRWHLFRCPTCAQEMALLQQTDALLHRLPEARTRPELTSEILGQIGIISRREECGGLHQLWKRLSARVAWFRYAFRYKMPVYVGIACLLVLVGLHMDRPATETPPDQESETGVVQVEMFEAEPQVILARPSRGYILY